MSERDEIARLTASRDRLAAKVGPLATALAAEREKVARLRGFVERLSETDIEDLAPMFYEDVLAGIVRDALDAISTETPDASS